MEPGTSLREIVENKKGYVCYQGPPAYWEYDRIMQLKSMTPSAL